MDKVIRFIDIQDAVIHLRSSQVESIREWAEADDQHWTLITTKTGATIRVMGHPDEWAKVFFNVK